MRFREDLTQSEIAERLGCSQMHVSRLLREIVSRLQNLAESDSRDEIGAGSGIENNEPALADA